MTEKPVKLPMWYRVLAAVVGVLAIILSLVVLFEPFLALWLLIFLLAFGLMFMGIDRLIIGISGQPLWWSMMPVSPASKSEEAKKS